MIVEQIWTGNAYRNFNYLIVCPDTGDSMAIDPLDHGRCLAATDPDLLVSTIDRAVTGVQLQLANQTNTLDIEIRRVNVPQIPCPMRLRWDLLLL